MLQIKLGSATCHGKHLTHCTIIPAPNAGIFKLDQSGEPHHCFKAGVGKLPQTKGQRAESNVTHKYSGSPSGGLWKGTCGAQYHIPWETAPQKDH